ncbi:MAG: zinc-binding dehydrogenase [Pirellulales bacterium]
MSDVGVVNFAPEKYSVELREIPQATIAPDQVLLEVQAVGVCGSDLHMWADMPSWPVNYPVVLGHEFCGVIREVGSQVRGWKEGDRAVSETAAYVDPDSPMTRQGRYNLDPNRKGYGAAMDGAMRRFVPVPSRILHRLPDNVSFTTAALTEPCCVAYNATVKNADIEPGDRVLVMGPGPIGILSAVFAQMRGAQVAVVGLERDRERLQVAAQYGLTTIAGDPSHWAREVDGLGVDGVIDAAGVSATLKTAMELVRPNGWISKVGWGPQPINFSLDPIVQKNVRLQGSFSHYWPIWERVIQLMSRGLLDVRPVIGGVWPLEGWHEAFETMHQGHIVKAVLEPAR